MVARGRQHVLDVLALILRDARTVKSRYVVMLAEVPVQNRCPRPVQTGDEQEVLIVEVGRAIEFPDPAPVGSRSAAQY
jgi:hypothetical protein